MTFDPFDEDAFDPWADRPLGAAGADPSLPPCLAVPPGGAALLSEDGLKSLKRSEAAIAFMSGPIIVAHASLTARRLRVAAPERREDLLDALELFAFVRPATFCAPSGAGLALAMGHPEPRGAEAQAEALRRAVKDLLQELEEKPWPDQARAIQLAETLNRSGWSWGPLVLAALKKTPCKELPPPGSGLEVWGALSEWEDQAPVGEPGSFPVTGEATRERLSALLQKAGLDEARPAQSDFAATAAHAFSPREKEGQPKIALIEAGTGIGKTLGYLAPASLFAEKNGPGVWISTYTRALQRQIDRESKALYPDEATRRKKCVVRKGRENYLCLLNYQELSQSSGLSGLDAIGVALCARWILKTRDGDMTGGDYPAWLPTLFSVPAQAQASPANLVDRRGECIHAGCPHYRVCFVEKAIRASKRADLVIANHALVMTQAAFDGARTAKGQKPDAESTSLSRIVFDEGHHLFEAADSAFSACLSGSEASELRRWIRGPESRSRRGRGLEHRLGDLVSGHAEAKDALKQVIRAAEYLPGEGWPARICAEADPELDAIAPAPIGPIETLLAAAFAQLRARSGRAIPGLLLECAARPASDEVQAAAKDAAKALAAIEAPLLALARALEDILDQEAEDLPGADRARIEGALRGLDRRACMALPGWRGMLKGLEQQPDEADPDFVDWFSLETLFGKTMDVGLRRHWVDPSVPLRGAVLEPAHGVLIASATLTDPALPDPFELARLRTGTAPLSPPALEAQFRSPFDYPKRARLIVVGDINRDEPRQVAAAMRELFLAAGGGALGLFTAIRRLKDVHALLAPALAKEGLPVYAQHIDPLEVGALVDVFRAEEHSCLLGTDAIRDGVDVPGRALRLICFDRVPWPRPDMLHKARRARFGGKAYDDAIARGRISQAFGRLIRRADDKGCFVMLDPAAPTRLFDSLPDGVLVERLSLSEAILQVREFLADLEQL